MSKQWGAVESRKTNEGPEYKPSYERRGNLIILPRPKKVREMTLAELEKRFWTKATYEVIPFPVSPVYPVRREVIPS
jgi:hypothetical protein